MNNECYWLLRSENQFFIVSDERHGKTFLLGKWQGDREISDPYRQQRPAFEHVYRLMDEGVTSWLRYL